MTLNSSIWKMVVLTALCVLSGATAACGPGGGRATQSPGRTPTEAPTQRGPDLPATTPLPVPGVPAALLDTLRLESARLSGITVEQLVIVRAEPVTWSDGSLGCPQPGGMYTQALVNGYWVVIAAAAREYDFRVDEDGSFRLCERAVPPGGAPLGTPGR